AWINATVNALKSYSIPYCVWGIDGDIGFLKTGTGRFPEDIDKDALEAYGFKMPDESLAAKTKAAFNDFPQKPYIVYDGLAGKGSRVAWRNGTKSAKDDEVHQHCEKASDLKDGYFKLYLPKAIASKVAKNSNDLVISFSVKFTDAKQTFMLELEDSDGGEELLPWTKKVDIKASDYKVGEWVTIQVPMSQFKDFGAYSTQTQKWIYSQDQFDWNRFYCVYFNFWHETPQKGDIYIDDVMFKLK
ncbi:MAG: hypothetical protein IKZ86_14935, partial [Spirochaetaceae bacterium]|nr:hypothetical protein [Spirochaetaceae bacterium]